MDEVSSFLFAYFNENIYFPVLFNYERGCDGGESISFTPLFNGW